MLHFDWPTKVYFLEEADPVRREGGTARRKRTVHGISPCVCNVLTFRITRSLCAKVVGLIL